MHWRGPAANGVAPDASPPIQWSEQQNVQWKVEIEGRGTSTPIVVADKVFVLTAIDTGQADPAIPKPEDQPKTNFFDIKRPNTSHRFVVICLDRESGDERWRAAATQKIPHEGAHNDNDFASASPTTDGTRLYCWFGSAGLFCYDLNGKQLWQRDLGPARVGSSLGEGCSPVIHDDKLVLVRDHAGQSMIHVLDAATGATIWERQRDEGNAWATPHVIRHSGRTQVITAASGFIRSYDLERGEVIWQCSGLTGNVIPCPVVDNGIVYCMSGYQGYSLMALPLSAQGDVSDTDAVIWRKNSGTPYVPSPVLDEGYLYFTQSNNAILTVLNAETGKEIIGRSRLSGMSGVYASLVAADGRVYIVGRNGTTVVLNRSQELDIAATNRLDERFDASPAVAGNQLFLRGARFLYCLSER